jgi:hypothetical protein
MKNITNIELDQHLRRRAMRGFFYFMLVAVFVFLFVNIPLSPAELIEPTQTLKGEQETTGKLTVLSEPPGLKITLDGDSIGKTPVFMVEIDSGIHTLRVKDSETDILVEPGKTVKISLFKNEFILIPVRETKVETEAEAEVKTETREKRPERPRNPMQIRNEENRRQSIKRFNNYIDGTKGHF